MFDCFLRYSFLLSPMEEVRNQEGEIVFFKLESAFFSLQYNLSVGRQG